MTCCDYGTCTQGRNCPVRKQRIEEANQAYIERGKVVGHNPYIETFDTVKSLLAWMVLVAVSGLAFIAWLKI
jgi:hypothetical protein